MSRSPPVRPLQRSGVPPPAVRPPRSGGGAAEGIDEAIVARGIIKEFQTEIGIRRVLDGVSFRVGLGERMAVLGRNGAGKSTLIQILSGVQVPTRGSIHRGIQMSWPLALAGGFEGELTGSDNVRFIARLYGAPLRETFDFVADFTEIGKQIHMPVRFYSSGMRMRLAFALSLAIDFDCYLIDEVILVGDKRFQEKCLYELFDRRSDRAMILAIHDMNVVRQRCTSVLVLKAGKGKVFSDVEYGVATYNSL